MIFVKIKKRAVKTALFEFLFKYSGDYIRTTFAIGYGFTHFFNYYIVITLWIRNKKNARAIDFSRVSKIRRYGKSITFVFTSWISICLYIIWTLYIFVHLFCSEKTKQTLNLESLILWFIILFSYLIFYMLKFII